MAAREREIQERLAALSPAEQERVLGYIREVGGERPELKPGRDLLRFAGIWTEEEAEEISKAIEEGCEKVDPDGWRAEGPLAAEGTARAFRDAIAAGRLPSEGVSGEVLRSFFGVWTPEEGAEMWNAIEEECRRVDPDAW
jgi:hypothetical protein